MPYGADQTAYIPPPEAWLDKIITGLTQYYENAADTAMRETFDLIARSGMGSATGLKDRVSSFLSAPRINAATNNFFDSCKAKVQMKLGELYANKVYYKSFLGATAAQNALEFGIGTLLTKVPGGKSIASLISGALFADTFNEIQNNKLNELRTSLGQAQDRQTSGVYKSFTSPNEAKEAAARAFDAFLQVDGILKTVGGAKPIQSWAEAVTFPERIFEARKLASKLNVQLVALESYLNCMRSHLVEVQKLAHQYRTQLPITLREGVNETLKKAYAEGRGAGVKAITAATNKAGGINKLGAMDFPPRSLHSDASALNPDPASLLATCIANAMAQGLYAGFADMYYRSKGIPLASVPTGPVQRQF
ncbi:MAG TPA: hypothetical protein VNE83_03855 [Terriglobales bacterium]|nr:hypothetical protein [Terriglobales bacterium]